MTSSKLLACLALSCAQFVALAHAEDQTNYDEPGIHFGRDYLSQHLTEQIDPFNGALRTT